MTRRFLRLLSCAVLICITPLAYAEQPSHCVVPVYEPKRKIVDENDNRIHISSDQVTSQAFNRFTAEGNITVQTPTRYFEADSATYTKDQQTIEAQNNIRYREKNVELHADELRLNLATNSGEAKNTRYQLIKEEARGKAGDITFENNIIQLENTTYTTCADGEQQWQLKAESITLNQAENEGIARNTRLEISGTPVLYLPYISFPLAGRKTGFLAPSPAYSSTDGFDLALPYYLNLAPNYDMTLTPRYIEKRGAQLSTEFRYLHKAFETTLGYETLPGDTQTDSDRTFSMMTFDSRAIKNTLVEAEFAHVSDNDYFRDLSSTLNTVNQTQLSRFVSTKTQGQSWQLTTLVQDYQILDGNQEPYRRLPQISLSTTHKHSAIALKTLSQYSYFNRSKNDRIQRAVFQPKLSLPVEKMAGFFIPSITFQASAYQLENNSQEQTFHNWLFRTDSGLFFERQLASGVQTLEPRLGYVYVPKKDQAEYPLIDSQVLDINAEQLFSANRYGGLDRVGGDNRITWAITSRLFDASGSEKHRVSYAQAHYLQDLTRHIASEKDINKGDYISALNVNTRLNKVISTSAQAVKISSEDKLHKTNLGLRYFNERDVLEFGYRKRDEQIEQLSGLGILSINSSWRIAGRWLYSLKFDQTQEALVGLEYNNCCWSVRFMARGYNTDANSDMKTSVGLQIELKGLARFGNNVEKQFSDEVLGNL